VLQRNQEFVASIQTQLHNIRYQRSRINSLDIPEIKNHLSILINQKHIYTDPELTLDSLAKLLGIASHQLSELLNNELSTTFRTYINQARIEDAKKLLLSKPNESILNIAFDCGFNSKSTFNAAFGKFTGLSPREFRELHNATTLSKHLN